MMINKILSRLEKVTQIGHNKWKACCPAHDDKDPSLYVTLTESGKILMHCFSGCDNKDILGVIGLDFGDIMGEEPTHHRLRPVDHDSRPYHKPLSKDIDMDSYYKTVLKIAEADAMKGVKSSSNDLKLIQQAEAYFSSKSAQQSPKGLLEFEAKRQRGERLTKAELSLERKMWLRTHRSGRM